MNNQSQWRNYREFWENFSKYLQKESDGSLSDIPKNGWCRKQGSIEHYVSYFFQVSTQEQEMSVYVIIESSDKEKNKKIYNKILPYRTQIENELGFDLFFEGNIKKDGTPRKSCRISYKCEGINSLDKVNFKQVATFLIEHMQKLTSVFEYYFFIIKSDSTNLEELKQFAKKLETMAEQIPISRRQWVLQEVRGKLQVRFRNELLKNYGGACAICGLSFEVALEAAHIIPYAEANDVLRISPQNGLLLCSVHHKLFDRGMITVGKDYVLNCQGSATVSSYDQLMLTEFDQVKLNVPKDNASLPNQSYLEYHQSKWRRF